MVITITLLLGNKMSNVLNNIYFQSFRKKVGMVEVGEVHLPPRKHLLFINFSYRKATVERRRPPLSNIKARRIMFKVQLL